LRYACGDMAPRRLSAEERAKIFKALSDPRRVEIVDLLTKDGSQCGTVLAEALGISLALVCHHSEVLLDAGILRKERVGQLRVCTVDTERIQEAMVWKLEAPAAKAPRPAAASTPRKRAR
jgi:ArsR family transcriptional regulator, arsenate/arsenite/antimonite-responsive transcriptional repressor